ncbi:MAG: serine/threonine protein kinase [Thermoanaerobaculia bacterium]|nr:serine/threonine protein kinase [Thermoanaerobaculia bacterium]
MSGDTERRLVEVLRRAAALPPDQRRTWIEFTSGGDPRLHAGLEALLRESATLGAGAALATGAALEGEVARELAARLASQGGRDLTGRQVGSIRLDALLGEGGMGSVYRGFDARLDRAVAVKTVRHPSPEGLARFRDEARLLGGTEHPGICRVYDLLEEPDCDFLVLELIDGLPLGRWAQAGHDLDARLAVAEQLAEALAFAHARGIVHRDLKPDNILVTPDGKARILDFGIATLVRPEATGEAPETPDAGRFAGTPGHMSPEQARGEPVGPPSDLFALGLILHELVSGRPAYPRDLPPEELFARARRGETEPLPALDRDLRELIASLENPIPSRRPSAVETAARLAGLRAAPQRRRSADRRHRPGDHPRTPRQRADRRRVAALRARGRGDRLAHGGRRARAAAQPRAGARRAARADRRAHRADSAAARGGAAAGRLGRRPRGARPRRPRAGTHAPRRGMVRGRARRCARLVARAALRAALRRGAGAGTADQGSRGEFTGDRGAAPRGGGDARRGR